MSSDLSSLHRQKIAEGLRKKRAERRLSQRDLAKELGAKQSTVSAWERTGGIPAHSLWELADFYGCPIDQLMGRDLPMVEISERTKQVVQLMNEIIDQNGMNNSVFGTKSSAVGSVDSNDSPTPKSKCG